MSVRVVARIRPLLDDELERDVIVHADSKDGTRTTGKANNIVKIPNPKNDSEEFSFAFNGVYDQDTNQEDLFTAEGTTSPRRERMGQNRMGLAPRYLLAMLTRKNNQ